MNKLEGQILKSKILVVDDEPANVALVERFLAWAGYQQVHSISDSSQCLATIARFDPDVILLDLHMPQPNGYEILATLHTNRPTGQYLPVLVFTADHTPEARKFALDCGASDFLTKPGDAQEILLRVRNFLQARLMHKELQNHARDLEARVTARTAELTTAQRQALEALARAAEFRDDETGAHTKRVGEMSARIAMAMGESREFVDSISLAAPLHDVGKIGIPDSILLKPGKLDDEELQVMRRHTIAGGQILADISSPLIRLAREIALCHHERWDGAGYPRGLKGDQIPLAARIVAVADVFDALTNERPYKKAWPVEQALAEIDSLRGKHFDPVVVDAFFRALDSERLLEAA